MTKIYRLVFMLGVLFLISCKEADGKNKNNHKNEITSSISSPWLTVFRAPEGAPKNNTFSVFVRYKGGDWVDLYEYDAEVDGGHLAAPVYHMAFVSFDASFSKKIEIKIHKNNGPMLNVKIRPQIAAIQPTIIDPNTIIFSLSEPKKLSVEINDDLHNNLMVFANKNEDNIIDRDDPGVHYFGPGIHKIGGNGQGSLVLHSNDKVYIAGGAIVYGSIEANAAKNISITGRGILCGGMYTNHAYPHQKGGKRLIAISNSTHIKIEGVTLLNAVSWNIQLANCTNAQCHNLKIMGWTINSDGIDPTSSSNVVIDDCFIRNYDDCISIKLSYGLAPFPNAKDSRNITVQNCILWTDQGRAIGFGPESYSSQDKIYEDITFKNIDILYNKNYDVDWAKGVISILLGDDATMKNVTFEDVRVDKIGSKTNLVTISVLQSPYNVSPGHRIQNIKFNRVTLNSKLNIDNLIHGYNQSKIISGVSFTNLKINNSYINNASSGSFQINNYTENVKFKVN